MTNKYIFGTAQFNSYTTSSGISSLHYKDIINKCMYTQINKWNIEEKSLINNLELLQKFDFQPLNTKSDHGGWIIQLSKPYKFYPSGGFKGGFLFCEN